MPLGSFANFSSWVSPNSPFPNENDIIGLDNGSDTSSPTLEVPISVVPIDPPLQFVNNHSMVTRLKVRIFKSKVLVVELHERKMRIIEEAFASVEWEKVA